MENCRKPSTPEIVRSRVSACGAEVCVCVCVCGGGGEGGGAVGEL